MEDYNNSTVENKAYKVTVNFGDDNDKTIYMYTKEEVMDFKSWLSDDSKKDFTYKTIDCEEYIILKSAIKYITIQFGELTIFKHSHKHIFKKLNLMND